jgi:hypothetical protein
MITKFLIKTTKPQGLSLFAWIWCLIIAALPLTSLGFKLLLFPYFWLFGASWQNYLSPTNELFYQLISLLLLIVLFAYQSGYKIAQFIFLLFVSSIFLTNKELTEIMLFGTMPALFLVVEQYQPNLQTKSTVSRIFRLLATFPVYVVCLFIYSALNG